MPQNFKSLKLKLDGPRIYLRTLTVDDASQKYADWLNDPEVNQFLATKSATVSELQDYIKAKDQEENTLFFGIFVKDNNQHIGTIKLDSIKPSEGKATVAIMIGDKNYWGKGIAGEAIQLLIDYSFQDLGLTEINLGVIDQNKRAIRAYEKLGFKETKRECKAVKYDDQLYDHVYMVFKKPK